MSTANKLFLFLFLWAVYAAVLLVIPFDSKGWLFHAAVSAAGAYASFVLIAFIEAGKESRP